MNNRSLSFAVILCTLIGCTIMIDSYTKENSTREEVIIANDITKEEVSLNETKDNEINEENLQLSEEEADLNIKEYDKNHVEGDEGRVPIQKDLDLNTNGNFNFIDEEVAPVFKVSTDIIREEVTLREKQRLLSIATNLSLEDLKKIKDYLYWRDEEEGVRRIIQLIKKELDSEDYEKVKDILGRYIYM